MLGAFKKMFGGPGSGADWSALSAWATAQGWAFKRPRDDAGFVIDATGTGRRWRLEFGPPSRDYIHGRELRLRAELGLPADLQMLVMSLSLVEQLERRTYEQSVEGLQTVIDTSTPEEVRWLVMLQRVNLANAKALKPLFAAVAFAPSAGAAWIEGPLAAQLERASMRLLSGKPPFVLMTQRGNAYLRVGLPEVDEQMLLEAVTLFETACAQALRVAGGRTDRSSRSTQASTSWPPDDEPSTRR